MKIQECKMFCDSPADNKNNSSFFVEKDKWCFCWNCGKICSLQIDNCYSWFDYLLDDVEG